MSCDRPGSGAGAGAGARAWAPATEGPAAGAAAGPAAGAAARGPRCTAAGRAPRPAQLALLALMVLLAPLPAAPGALAAQGVARGGEGPEGDAKERFRAALGSEPARAWELFGAADLRTRRALADLARPAAGPESLEGLLRALAAESDPLVRGALVETLGGLVPLGPGPGRERAARLASLALADPDPRVRLAALGALAEAGGEAAAAELDRLLDRLPPAEAVAAARALASLGAAAEEQIAARVRRATAAAGERAGEHRGEAPRGERDGPGARVVSAGVLAALLPSYGRALAERGAAALTPRDRAALARALRHPDPALRRAADAALTGLVARLRLLQRPLEADRVLAELATEGLDPGVAGLLRARLLLEEGQDGAAALEAARRLGRTLPASGAAAADLARFRGRYLEGLALLALDRPEEAAGTLAAAAEILDGLIADRLDLGGRGGAREHGERLHVRALVEVARALAALTGGRPVADRAVLEPLRAAHELELEAQAHAARGRDPERDGWEVVLGYELSPYTLLFATPTERWPLARIHDLQRELGRGFATVAPGEFPGFEPVPDADPELSDPLADPRRARRLLAIVEARLERNRDDQRELFDGVLSGDAGAGFQDPAVQRRWREIQIERTILERWRGEPAELARNLRTPTRLALRLAGDLRLDGRAEEARELALALLEALFADGRTDLLAQELAAQTEILVGSTWMDDDEPRRAEEVLESAIERFELLERTLAERGAGEPLLRHLRQQRASALVSLAVNANVRLSQPERATVFFEQAYELRQDDFMRVLLACYRARMGRAEEARRLLADVRVSPPLYYNLACTHALLGESARALELLELDFETNHPSAGALERQKRWAARDPDLASLRDDPRFQWLVGSAAEEGDDPGGGEGDGEPRGDGERDGR